MKNLRGGDLPPPKYVRGGVIPSPPPPTDRDRAYAYLLDEIGKLAEPRWYARPLSARGIRRELREILESLKP